MNNGPLGNKINDPNTVLFALCIRANMHIYYADNYCYIY